MRKSLLGVERNGVPVIVEHLSLGLVVEHWQPVLFQRFDQLNDFFLQFRYFLTKTVDRNSADCDKSGGFGHFHAVINRTFHREHSVLPKNTASLIDIL